MSDKTGIDWDDMARRMIVVYKCDADQLAQALQNEFARLEAEERARLDWLSAPGRTCDTQERDMMKSKHVERKCVRYYVNGVSKTANGDTLRDAIDSARKEPHER